MELLAKTSVFEQTLKFLVRKDFAILTYIAFLHGITPEVHAHHSRSPTNRTTLRTATDRDIPCCQVKIAIPQDVIFHTLAYGEQN